MNTGCFSGTTSFLRRRLLPVVYASAVVALSSSASAQQDNGRREELFALHPRAGFLKSWYTADFRSFQGAIDCGVFTDGDGQGAALSLTVEYPLADRLFLGLGIGYMDRSGSLVNPGSFPARDTGTGEVVTVRTENTIEATLQYLELQPEVRYTLVPDFLRGPLRSVAALRFAFPMTTTFSQTEDIVAPDNAAFTAGGRRTRQRSIAGGEIYSRSSTGIGATAGVENMLRIGSNLFLTQQVLFDYNFTDITTDASWTTFGVRLEAGVRYAFTSSPPAPPPPPPPPVIDTTPAVVVAPPPPPPPVASIRIDNVLDASTELEVGNELVATLPLVNAVFFEKNSPAIPDRYVRVEGRTKPDDAVAAHRYILADIAAIVRKNPDARITLHGATSGTADEPTGRQLAEERAGAVRDALAALGVPENIMTTRSSLYPPNPSNQEFEEGREENRRVDIIVHNAPLQEYVAKRRYAELHSTVTGAATLANLPDAADAEIVVNVADTVVRLSSSGTFAVPFTRRVEAGQSADLTVVATLTVDKANLRAADEARLPMSSIPVREVELQLDSFEPILRFDYDRSTLSDANKGLLRQMAELLPQGAIITILGSADALGAEKRNAELSRERALTVEKFIRSVAGDKFTITSSGADAKFPDATPEGRFLNRSIRVRVTQ